MSDTVFTNRRSVRRGDILLFRNTLHIVIGMDQRQFWWIDLTNIYGSWILNAKSIDPTNWPYCRLQPGGGLAMLTSCKIIPVESLDTKIQSVYWEVINNVLNPGLL